MQDVEGHGWEEKGRQVAAFVLLLPVVAYLLPVGTF